MSRPTKHRNKYRCLRSRASLHRPKSSMKYYLLAVLFLSGCAGAHCQRFEYPEFNAIVCDDAAVAKHCLFWIQNQGRALGKPIPRSVPGLNDDGSSVTQGPRGCTRPSVAGRKPDIEVGRSYMACVLHESCHAMTNLTAAQCSEKYPCVGD